MYFQASCLLSLGIMELVVKNLSVNTGDIRDVGSIPGSRRSSILAWRIPWPEEPGGATVHGVAQSRTQLKQLSTHRNWLALEGQSPQHQQALGMSKHHKIQKMKDVINTPLFSPKAALF